MTPVQFHEFDWLPEDALNGRTSLPKTSMLASMPAGKGDVTLIHKKYTFGMGSVSSAG